MMKIKCINTICLYYIIDDPTKDSLFGQEQPNKNIKPLNKHTNKHNNKCDIMKRYYEKICIGIQSAATCFLSEILCVSAPFCVRVCFHLFFVLFASIISFVYFSNLYI